LAMADSWLFNAGLYLVLLNYFEPQTIKILLLSVFVAYGLVTCIRRLKSRHSEKQNKLQKKELPILARWSASKYGFRGDWLFLVFLLALPVI